MNKKDRSRYRNLFGGVAHLGERLNGIQEVEGSIPFVSTRKKARTAGKLYELSAHERAKEKRERISKGGKYTIVYLLKIWEILV